MNASNQDSIHKHNGTKESDPDQLKNVAASNQDSIYKHNGSKESNPDQLKNVEASNQDSIHKHNGSKESDPNRFNNVEELPIENGEISKWDLVADRIINFVSVKTKPRYIDEDRPEDFVSYEVSDKRLTCLALSIGILLSIASFICLIFIVNVSVNQPKVLIAQYGEAKDKLRFPNAHVLLMEKQGDGSLLVFRQINQSFFEYGWKFKVPGGQSNIHSYILFEDLGQVYVAYSNMNKKMTILQTSAIRNFTDFTIPRSELRQEFVGGYSLHIGKFVLVFGGKNEWNPFFNFETKPSSIHTQSVTTEIWSMVRNKWIKGPYLPSEAEDASYACGVPENRTHGIILAENKNCIDAYTYSVEIFAWVEIKQCVTKKPPDFQFTLKITCASYFDKGYKMSAVMHHAYVNLEDTFIQKIFLLKVPSLTSECLYEKVPTGCGQSTEMTAFTLRNQVYFVRVDKYYLTFYTLNVGSNKTLIFLQELKHPEPSVFAMEELNDNCKMILSWDEEMKQALPFYA